MWLHGFCCSDCLLLVIKLVNISTKCYKLIVFYHCSSDFALFSNYRVNQILRGKLNDEICEHSIVYLINYCITAVLGANFIQQRVHLYIQKQVCNASYLKVSSIQWKHKVPEHRSAFSDWRIFHVY